MSVIPGLPPLPACFSGLVGSDTSQSRETEKFLSPHAQSSVEEQANREDTSSQNCDVVRNGSDSNTNRNLCNGEASSDRSPFCQLNTTLTKLRKEMVDLRQMDVSLLCQLWSLHESIQDYKTVLQDNYSEYSFGTDMSSRASSFSSLNESNDESDWNEPDYATQDDLTIYGQSMHSSTSSLLQQINELKERVDSEFSFC
ncbi:leucine repeat adapter protein 25-like [Gigantopelta aegis]|uniref:leucine repeat adapter protein 25-like n=1 Tax=Gigantopelta aegis TaxID=1735272 RepID=UPI001B88C2EB|nr:leucine repeat adapter protein 25-like [Gigantopelta aegis]